MTLTHDAFWFVIGTATFCSVFGIYVVILKVQKYTTQTENVLIRRGDIELIEPIRPLRAYNPRNLDLTTPEFPSYQRVSTHAPSYDTGPLPSYHSETLPTYQNIDIFYINSCLENENIINPELILLIILFILIFLFLIIFIKRFKKELIFQFYLNKKI